MKACTQEDYNKGMQWYIDSEIRRGIAKPDKELITELKIKELLCNRLIMRHRE